ncbi:unnamed protein product [Leptosia nina]|uniref:Uncharacterized protein n=1 Tax=Leptosia nina TaxID=320188 RepID=A0AAV1JLM0_9NEOP
MLRTQNSLQPNRGQGINQNPFIEKLGMKPFFTSNPQAQQGFKFGVQGNPTTSNSYHPQANFKFGIPTNKQINVPPAQPQQLGYKPQLQQQFGYRPQFNHGQPQIGYKPPLNQNSTQFGYRPQFNQGQQQQFGYRPQFNQGQQQQFGYRPQFNQGQQQFGFRPPQKFVPQISTDVSMRTAPPLKPQGFRMNELYNLNEPEIDDANCIYENSETNYYNDCNDAYPINDTETYETTIDQDDQTPSVQNVENFHITLFDGPLK